MSIHGLTSWAKLRGFNYQPGYSAQLQYTWTHFDSTYWEREVPWALRFGTNTLRVWLDWGAYLAIGDTLYEHLDRALIVLDRAGIRMVPVLFNRWTDPRFPAGGIADQDLRSGLPAFAKFFPYVDGLLERFGDDSRIALWDLCNEPQAPGPTPEVALHEVRWLATLAERVRRRSTIPVTIGTMVGDNVATFAPLVDVISFHPYPKTADGMEPLCREHLALAEQFGKPLLCTETCVGSLDDHERGTMAQAHLEMLEQYDIGWLAWQLVTGPFVTGSRNRTDSNAVRPGEGYMPFLLENGATRPGHEWLVKLGGNAIGSSTISVIRPPYRTGRDTQ